MSYILRLLGGGHCGPRGGSGRRMTRDLVEAKALLEKLG